jgi:hypothetical protein
MAKQALDKIGALFDIERTIAGWGDPATDIASALCKRERRLSQQTLPMRNVRDVLRLKAAGLGNRKIAASPQHQRRGSWCMPPSPRGRRQLTAARGY